MSILKFKRLAASESADGGSQKGSAIVIAIFLLALISVFVALALSRTTAEANAVGNETAEGRTFYAAQGSLEMMTRNFNKVFEVKLNPADVDFNPMRNAGVPGFGAQYDFSRQMVNKTSNSVVDILNGGPFAGLYATRDNWQLKTTVTDLNRDVQVELTRNIINNRIPIFQFGIFYNDDLEFHPGPRFAFGGRVHSNGSLFLMAKDGLYFSSKVSAVGEILTDVARNGKSWTNWNDEVFIKNASGADVQLQYNMGSVLADPANGTPVFNDQANNPKLYNPNMPTVYKSSNWTTNQTSFDGNLLSKQPSLDLPLKIASVNAGTQLDYIELIKRGKNVGDLYNSGGTPTAPTIDPVTTAFADSEVTVSERYYNKTGIRISLADSKAKLPGCASGTGTTAVTTMCGVRLDGASSKPTTAGAVWADADADGSHGYQPLAMTGTPAYQATRLNGERFRTSGNQVWIKVELVSRNPVSNVVTTNDVTEDILSLGVSEAAPLALKNKDNTDYGNADSRSIIKLQRFSIPGEIVPMISSNPVTTAKYMTYYSGHNYVNVSTKVGAVVTNIDKSVGDDRTHHYKYVVLGGTDFRIVPFPIEMFDTREGLYTANGSILDTAATYGLNVPWAGVMSMVDIDMANLKRFLDGNFDTNMPSATKYFADTGHVLRNSPTDPLLNDVPQVNGWVVYVSDRRGDSDFDGEYDMEDIYGNNDNVAQPGENVNNSISANGGLDVNYNDEGVKYTSGGVLTIPDPGDANSFIPSSLGIGSSFAEPGLAATVDHKYYRRGVRLINGRTLPGKYDWANPDNTRGLTVASENGVYVLGDYNATGTTTVGNPTASESYRPQGKAVVNGVTTVAEIDDGTKHVPASIVADAVTILSNSWSDSRSFLYPFRTDDLANSVATRRATETWTRFAMIAGDARSSFEENPNQGGSDPRMSGGVHNFKRYLEKWAGTRHNYVGSIINLYNARNNNGAFKSDTKVYQPPNRNWVFDSSFLDPARLPPGTPFFQYIQTTGFQRTNN